MPRNGIRIRKMTHSAFTPPDMEWSRNRSVKITISSQNQITNRKNSSIHNRTLPLPNELLVEARNVTSVSLVRNSRLVNISEVGPGIDLFLSISQPISGGTR